MILAGVDGCRGGWVMVARDPAQDAWTVHAARGFAELPPVDLLAVDMPIGLPDGGRRGCDFAARRLLGRGRSASVFIGLRRPLLAFADYPAANAWCKTDGAGLAKQAWYLLPKIAEIDRALAPADQERVRECHPELAFMRLAGEPLAESKLRPEGLARRRRLLEAAGIDVGTLLALADRRHAAADDVMDAAVLWLTARHMAEGTAIRLPEGDPPRDARGLRMEIWY
jgi:predicted RNase H-like nuclease